MHKWRKVAMLASVGAFLPALVVCDLPDHGSIFGIDYEIRSHDGFDFGDLFDMFDRHRHDDCWFFCDDDDGWDFDFDFDFD